MVHILLLFLLCVVNGNDPPCTKRDQCSCVTADNQVIDLTSLGRTDGTPRFLDLRAPDGYLYSYNPCVPFNELACSGQSVCQIPPDKSTSYPAGDASSAVFSNDGVSNHVIYTSIDGSGTKRTTDVTLVCDSAAVDAKMTPIGSQGSATYNDTWTDNIEYREFGRNGEFIAYVVVAAAYLTLFTKCACPNGCGPGNTGGGGNAGGGLSVGTILCISMLGIAAVYLISGMAFMKLKRKASGIEMIPNSVFWISIVGNVKNGFLFIYSTVRRQQYKPI